MGPLLLLLVSVIGVAPYKFLAVSPRHASSPVNFQARITDVLIEAGHEVVMLSPAMDSCIGPGTDKARIIEIPQCKEWAEHESVMNAEGGSVSEMWTKPMGSIFAANVFDYLYVPSVAQCDAMLAFPGLIEQLRAEQFDAAYAETIDFCAFGLFHILGIEKFAVTQSLSMLDGDYHYTQAAGNPAYVPSELSGQYTDRMGFFDRLHNTLTRSWTAYVTEWAPIGMFDVGFKRIDPAFPGIEQILPNASYVFINSEPLTDFPRPTSSKMIDIGGITVSNGGAPLNETWSYIMDLRPRTVLISFGTLAKTYLMPEEYKKTIRETARKFPDVTFIWKYEKPSHNISRGIANLVESTWVPQNDMLRDPRLSAFVTHCGQGSTTEAMNAGVPLVVIPIFADQPRNAYTAERNGMGIVMDKRDLRAPGPLEDALREVLENNKYRKQAAKVARMLSLRPFSMRETFIRHMEFLAEFGPLRQLNHHGAQLSFIQYYLIDIILFLVVCSLVFITLVLLAARHLVKAALRHVKIVQKQKDE